MSKPTSLDPIEGLPETATKGTADTTSTDSQSHPNEAIGKVKEVLEKAKEGFDNLSDQKIGARIGDDPA